MGGLRDVINGQDRKCRGMLIAIKLMYYVGLYSANHDVPHSD